ncbi:hypothetical protein BJV74DRAFT_861122 [Russula compacta]|nr:hypothetical protein BJV74DRAFT_861122 [Russula compacta]
MPTPANQCEIPDEGPSEVERGADFDPVYNILLIGCGPVSRGGASDQEPKEIRMIGNFNGCNYDVARIQALKDDMDGVLIFVGLFSATLASFTLDSKQNLKVIHIDQMVYFLEQNVAISAQISNLLYRPASTVSGLYVSHCSCFVRLCDSVLNINTTVGVSTIVPIGISGFF